MATQSTHWTCSTTPSTPFVQAAETGQPSRLRVNVSCNELLLNASDCFTTSWSRLQRMKKAVHWNKQLSTCVVWTSSSALRKTWSNLSYRAVNQSVLNSCVSSASQRLVTQLSFIAHICERKRFWRLFSRLTTLRWRNRRHITLHQEHFHRS